MHTTIAERVKAARLALGLSQKEAVSKFGIPLGSIRKYETGPSEPGSPALAGMTRAGINANYLLTGEGPILSKDLQIVPGNHDLDEQQSGYVAVALYNDIRAAAGHGAVVEREAPPDDALMFKADWIRVELGAKPTDLRLIRVSGDSMEPTLRAGDVILVDLRTRRPDREGIYILRMGEMLLVKRLQALPGGRINVFSDNPTFATWSLKVDELEGEDVAIIGRVVWAGRRL